MEAVGQLILGLHQNLAEIRAAAASGPHNPRLQAKLAQAEAVVRSEARNFCLAAGSCQGIETQAQRSPGSAPRRCHSLSNKRTDLKVAFEPEPTQSSLTAQFLGASSEDEPNQRSDFWLQRPQRSLSKGSRRRSKTTGPNRLLPKANRLDPLSDAPQITERDLERGLLNLHTRGFIPPDVDLTPALERGVPVMMLRPAPLYDQTQKHVRREVALADDMLTVKLDGSWPRKPHRGPKPGPRCNFHASLPPLMPAENETPRSLPALPAPPLLQPIADGQAGVIENYGTFCTELLETAPDDPSEDAARGAIVAVIGALPNLEGTRSGAATLLGAWWRGAIARRHCKQLRRKWNAARRIQSVWASALTRVLTKMEIQRVHEERRSLFLSLRERLEGRWFHAKQMRRVEVHIGSLTLAETRRYKIDGFQALQGAQVSRIFRVVDSKTDVIFVAPKMLHEDILDYYSKIMQFRGVKNPPGRFQVVVPENMDLISNLSLSQGLLCSPKALRRIRNLVAGRQAYVVPEAVTHAEVDVASKLGLPLFGPGPQNIAVLASKSNVKRLVASAGLQTVPGAADIYDDDEFFTSLAGLVLKHPQIRTWVFKIDDERDSRGIAYIDLRKIKELAETLSSVGESAFESPWEYFSDDPSGAIVPPTRIPIEGDPVSLSRREASQEPAAVGTNVNAVVVRNLLQRHVPKRVQFCNRAAYPDFNAWMAEASRVGTVIQAVPEGRTSHATVHIQVEPDKSIRILGSSETVFAQPFVRAASLYPHTEGDWAVLKEVGLRMGSALSSRGHVGFASVDVVFCQNPDWDPMNVESDRETTPVVIGGDSPVDPEHLMFANLRSPSPSMSSSHGGTQGCFSDALPASLPESRQAAYEYAMQLKGLEPPAKRKCFMEKVLGVSPDFRPAASSPILCWVVDVDARLTDEAASLFPLQFTAQLRFDATVGQLILQNPTNPARKPVAADGALETEAGMNGEDAGDSADSQRRFALVSRIISLPGLDRMSHQTLFQTAKMRGISYDLFHNVGSVFSFLDVVHSFVSILTVEETLDVGITKMASALSALAEGCAKSNRQPATWSSSKASAPRERSVETSGSAVAADVLAALRVVQKRRSERGRQSP